MKFITILLVLTLVSANNLRSKVKYNTIECKELEHPKCLKWNNSTQGCYVIDCWKYDSIAGCEKDGKPLLPAIILQSIPFTGVFGSGFGNIGRWDIFSWYMVGFFGPPVLICLIGCCWICKSSDEKRTPLIDKDDDDNVGLNILSMACGCVWAIIVLVLWIWGIVTIANKDIEAPWVSANGTKIMCPMI
jgi:hypothetical protein